MSLWPDSGDRPTHDGDRMVALVRGMTGDQVKAEFIDACSDVEVLRLVTDGLASVPFRRLEARLLAAKPMCGGVWVAALARRQPRLQGGTVSAKWDEATICEALLPDGSTCGREFPDELAWQEHFEDEHPDDNESDDEATS